MARLIKADGTEEIVHPKGKRWTLSELQTMVGGYIEYMPGINPTRMVMNEEGNIKGQSLNIRATKIVTELLKGKNLRYQPHIRGDVLILETGEKT